MSEPGLITDYLARLSADLPGGFVEELADGLDQTRQHYLEDGLDPDAAARAAVADFGDPGLIVTAFARASPARRTARRLLAAGPIAGACWGAALLTSRAGTWQVPLAARVLFGLALIAVVGLLAVAALGQGYRQVCHAGAAGCVGIAAIDAAMLTAVMVAIPVLAWPVTLAIAASTARLSFTAGNLRSVLSADVALRDGRSRN
jgi:hypothetical protein